MNTKEVTRRLSAIVLAAGAALLIAPSVHAQAWPSKPIKVIVPYTPGGFTDITARLVSQKLQDRLGQPLVIENKPGANSIIGVDALAKSPPDGYTLLVVAFTVGALSVFFDVAYQASLVRLVARDQLVRGNSALEGSRSVAQIGGPALGGALVSLLSAPIAAASGALFFALSCLSIRRIRRRE